MKNDAHRTWSAVFQQELELVKKRHSGAAPVEKNLVGLAFSGGGIRSATFGLGVLEGLKKFGLLKKIDYLSTVSGGGYIGAWLSANCKRAATGTPAADWLDPDADWEQSVRHLRRYSNYLSPIVGFFSADTWSMAMIWIRNTLLVQLTVILAIAVALLMPRPLFVAFEHWPQVGAWRWATIGLFILGVVGIAANQLRVTRRGDVPLLQGRSWPVGLAGAAMCLAIAWGVGALFHFDPFGAGPIDYRAAFPIAGLLVLAGFWLQPAAVRFVSSVWPGEDPPQQINYNQAWVQFVVVIPMMATGFLVAAILWGQSQPGSGELAQLDTFGGFFTTAWKHWPFPLSVTFVSLWLLSFCGIRSRRDRNGILAALLAPIPAILVLHALLCAIMLLLHQWASNGPEGKWLACIWTPALVLYAFSLTIVMLIGMLGRQSPEGAREWWSRLGAWLGIYAFAWMVINLAAAYGPQWSAMLLNRELNVTWKTYTAVGGWVATTLAGLLAGKSDTTGGKSGEESSSNTMEVVAAVAPFVFIAGLLVAVSTALHVIIAINSDLTVGSMDHWQVLTSAKGSIIWAVLAGCFAGLLLLAWRVDINEFGLNAFYRSRLVRCYLGATRHQNDPRHPQNFTGFDDKDDLELATLAEPEQVPAGPLHIVNCALNLGGSSDLSLHTRHSATFTLTPLYCGSVYKSRNRAGKKEEMGYTPTAGFGGKEGQPTLGQAISVSGAAASPNMGYHTSPVIAFLMTLFNVRLGWWFPHPQKSGVNSSSPLFSLRYLFMELFGGADDTSKYLAISDGGHFENLAAYELVQRKCRVIVISDGECDPKLQFVGLGTLIRMCEVDLGAKITIDVGSIRRVGGTPWSASRFAVGSIEYDDHSHGTLVYLKASMTGGENTDILQYKATRPVFPHESTGDQFYGEDQFESYRGLGREIATQAFEPVCNAPDFVTLASNLEKLSAPA